MCIRDRLWIVLVAFIICTLVVYTLRKQAIAHAWTIAVITGAVVNIVAVSYTHLDVYKRQI